MFPALSNSNVPKTLLSDREIYFVRFVELVKIVGIMPFSARLLQFALKLYAYFYRG